jgi:hypothetical protein
MKEKRRSLHEQEIPVAIQSSLMANLQRDPKSRRTPYEASDFYAFASQEDLKLPSGSYGAAAVKLVKDKRMPPWALFCFKELNSTARKDYTPAIAGFVCDDAVLLHPKLTPEGWKGLLIARESASFGTRLMYDDKGAPIMLLMPEIPTKVIAKEDVTLSLSANLGRLN